MVLFDHHLVVFFMQLLYFNVFGGVGRVCVEGCVKGLMTVYGFPDASVVHASGI